jgi:glucose-6-phosphate 1-epimerase
MTTGAGHQELAFQGQPCLQIKLAQGDSATVALQGAQLLSWKTADAREQLYLSPRAVIDGSSAIRGGVPICFPQFNQRVLGGQALPKHGFVRNLAWSLLDSRQTDVLAEVQLGLQSSPATLTLWPHQFAAVVTLKLEPGCLRVGFEVQNTGPDAWLFALALHSYLLVSDIADVSLNGLAGLSYWDAVQHPQEPEKRLQQADAPLLFTGETDRVYARAADFADVTTPIELRHAAGGLHISQSASLADVVVWNPGESLSAAIADLPADGFRHYVCVEAARLNQPVLLGPGAAWAGWQQLEATPPN